MSRFRIDHMTTLSYDRPVLTSHNEVRMSPTTEPGQTTLDNRIRVQPMTWSYVYRDYFATMVTAIECVGAHSALHVESVSTVDTSPRPPAAESISWDGIADAVLRDRHYEWLRQTPRTQPGDDTSAAIEGLRGLGSPRQAALTVCALVNDHMSYETGFTGVHSTSQEAWLDRRGVCQDFAQVTIGALRLLGIPARYVSGYLCPELDLPVGQSAVGESHAWVEFWDGGWIPADPTNLREVGEDHIVVARGRDYEDVPPFKGVYSGAAVSDLTVSVEFLRLE
jgi:transglutaminase-like putative cysteine protease